MGREGATPASIKAYNAGLSNPILIKRSPGNVHAMNGFEPQGKRLSMLANMAAMKWSLGRAFGIDLVAAAAEQLNDTVVLFSSILELRTQTRWQSFTRGQQVTDLSRWLGSPGQTAWAHVSGSKANMGDVKARAAIFLYPLRGAGGFVVRMLESRRLMVAYSVYVVRGRELRHARLMASDDLRHTYGYRPVVTEQLGNHVRSMFAETPGSGIEEFMVRVGPLGRKAPVRLEPVLNSEQEWVLDDARSTVDVGSPHASAALHARLSAKALPYQPQPSAGQRPPAAEGGGTGAAGAGVDKRAAAFGKGEAKISKDAAGRVWRKWLQGAGQDDLRIAVSPTATKSGKSGVRFEAVRGARSIREYRQFWTKQQGKPARPTKGLTWFKDLFEELWRGLVTLHLPTRPPVVVHSPAPPPGGGWGTESSKRSDGGSREDREEGALRAPVSVAGLCRRGPYGTGGCRALRARGCAETGRRCR